MKVFLFILIYMLFLSALAEENIERSLGRLACLAGAVHPDPDLFDENIPDQIKQHCPSQGNRPRFKSAPKTNAIKRIFDSLFHTIFGPTVRRGITERNGCHEAYIDSITQDNLSFNRGSLDTCVASLYFDQLHHHPSRIPLSRINSCHLYFCHPKTSTVLQEYLDSSPSSQIIDLKKFLNCPDAQFQI